MSFILFLAFVALIGFCIYSYLEGLKCPKCRQEGGIKLVDTTPLGMATQTRYDSRLQEDGSRKKYPYQVTITKYIEHKHCEKCGHRWQQHITKQQSSKGLFD